VCVCVSYLGVCCSSLKMCTVSVLLEAHRNCPSALNDNELMLTYLTHTHTHTHTHTLCINTHY